MKQYFLILLGALAASAGLAANPYIVMPDGRKVEGTEVRANREGVVYLTTSSGRLEYPKGTKVVMDQPADLARAEGLVQKKQYAEAMPLLEKAVEDSRFLGWDVKARALLASAYLGQGEAKKAVGAYESLMADFTAMKDDETVRAGYLQALASAGELEKVKPLLDEAIRKGPRGEAAMAQMLRARARGEAGDIEGALSDYMRTARFFRQFKDQAGEATLRTAEYLEKLGETEKAGVYYRQVVQDYPDSPFAAQAKTKTGQNP
jgi:tetratricopeptide (TPR) repeat protein